VCNEGYSSSLAAHTLQRLGLPQATDLVGGFQASLASSRASRPDLDLGASVTDAPDAAAPG